MSWRDVSVVVGVNVLVAGVGPFLVVMVLVWPGLLPVFLVLPAVFFKVYSRWAGLPALHLSIVNSVYVAIVGFYLGILFLSHLHGTPGPSVFAIPIFLPLLVGHVLLIFVLAVVWYDWRFGLFLVFVVVYLGWQDAWTGLFSASVVGLLSPLYYVNHNREFVVVSTVTAFLVGGIHFFAITGLLVLSAVV